MNTWADEADPCLRSLQLPLLWVILCCWWSDVCERGLRLSVWFRNEARNGEYFKWGGQRKLGERQLYVFRLIPDQISSQKQGTQRAWSNCSGERGKLRRLHEILRCSDHALCRNMITGSVTFNSSQQYESSGGESVRKWDDLLERHRRGWCWRPGDASMTEM